MRDNWSTPYKLGKPLLQPSGIPGAFDSHGVDCPFVFYHQGRFMMMYVGFDGIGYQTALAESDDLIDWRPVGTILNRKTDEGWDRVGAAGTWLLKETNELSELPVLKKVGGKYWMVYHAYPEEGYEAGPAEMGLAWSEDENLMNWHRLKNPVFSWKQGEPWERGGLYKAALIAHGGLYYMFYNAKDLTEGKWYEQTGVAMSKDMLHWTRYEGNPVIRNRAGWQSHCVADPFVAFDHGQWVLFYFGYDGVNAQEGLAVSDDLLEWYPIERPILEHGEKGELDEMHAHKPSVVRHNGVLYHFYCAVRSSRPGDPAFGLSPEFRTITAALSQPYRNSSEPKSFGE
ncbi:hypothetical protein K7P76_02305 [Cohnella sp. NL03-T5]|nr:hypothetical protein [Cohnella silvisoli]